MQLSEKDKQALQEKYKEQRQAMWSGKQSTPQESEEKTEEGDHGDVVEDTTDSTDSISSDTRSDPPPAATDQSSPAEAVEEKTTQSEPYTHSDSETTAPQADVTSSAKNSEEQEEAEQETEDEREFWETLEQEGGTSLVTWKLVVAVIGVAAILVGVGVYLGFLFAG